VTKEHSLLRRFFFGSDPSRAWREEKVLRYIIHRIDEDAELHESPGPVGAEVRPGRRGEAPTGLWTIESITLTLKRC
jgi:hypothetical protein